MLGVFTALHRRLHKELDPAASIWIRGLLVGLVGIRSATRSTSRTRSGAALVKNNIKIEAASVVYSVLVISTAVTDVNLVNPASVKNLFEQMAPASPPPSQVSSPLTTALACRLSLPPRCLRWSSWLSYPSLISQL